MDPSSSLLHHTIFSCVSLQTPVQTRETRASASLSGEWLSVAVCLVSDQVSQLEDGPSVKMNTAAVLREGARVQNELLQQEKR